MKTILIIEDNQDVRENTADILELANYDIQTAEDGIVGVKKARQYKPDIILCDIMMPKLDGYGVLEALSLDKSTRGIPFIFLTAKTEKRDVRKGMNLGADDYLTKPFEEDELLDAIHSRLKKNSFFKKEFSKDVEGLNQFLEEASSYIDIESLSKDFEGKTYKVKDHIFREGSAANTLFFIERGTIKTYRTTESGKEFVTGLYKAGDFIGQLALVTNKGTYTESAMVIDEAEVHGIPKSNFIALLHENQDVSEKFITMISNNLIEMQEQLVSMAFSSVRQKVAKALLDLDNKGILTNKDDESIGIAREDFAGIIGTATETAIRMLTEFKEEGIISIGAGRRIHIENRKALEQIVN